jgi:hypothetical protein
MKVTFAEQQGISLDVLMKVNPGEEVVIEPELFLEVPQELYDRWNLNYVEAALISRELFDLYQEQHGND